MSANMARFISGLTCASATCGDMRPIGNGQSEPKNRCSFPNTVPAWSSAAGAWVMQSAQNLAEGVARRAAPVLAGRLHGPAVLNPFGDCGHDPAAVRQTHHHPGVPRHHAGQHHLARGDACFHRVADDIAEKELVEARVAGRAGVNEEEGGLLIQSLPERLVCGIGQPYVRSCARRHRVACLAGASDLDREGGVFDRQVQQCRKPR